MAKKYKTTGFARFFIVMIFLAPLAYIGASYYNGEDGLENFKNLIGLGEKTEQVDQEAPESEPVAEVENQEQEREQGQAVDQGKVEALQAEIEQLEEIIKNKDQEIKYLKDKIKALEE